MLRSTVFIAVIFSFYYVGVSSDYRPTPIAATIDWKKVQGKWYTVNDATPDSMEISVANGNYRSGSVKINTHDSLKREVIEYGQIDEGLNRISVEFYDLESKVNMNRFFVPVKVEYDSYMIFLKYSCPAIKTKPPTGAQVFICSLFHRITNGTSALVKEVELITRELSDREFNNQPYYVEC